MPSEQSGAPRFYMQTLHCSYDTFAQVATNNTTALAVRCFYYDTASGEARYRENGAEVGSDTIALSALTTAKFSVGYTGGQYLTGKLKEVVLFDRQLTTAEFAAIETYLIERNGVTV